MKWIYLFNEKLEKLFFQKISSKDLNLFRFLYCGSLIIYIVNSFPEVAIRYAKGMYNPIPLFELVGLGLMDYQSLYYIYLTLVVSLTLAMLGILTRVSLYISWICFFLYMGTKLGFAKMPGSNYVYHSQNIIVFVLFILSVSPGISDWGIVSFFRKNRKKQIYSPPHIPNWPTQLIKSTIALAYFGAGYCKIATSFLWADGYTLQAYFLHRHILLDMELSGFLAQFYYLCLFLGIASLILELTFFLIIFFPRLAPFYVFSALMFHVSVIFTMDINFLKTFALVYLVFIRVSFFSWLYEEIRYLLGKEPAVNYKETENLDELGDSEKDSKTEASKSISEVDKTNNDETNESNRKKSSYLRGKCVVLGVIGTLLLCIFARIESWPFTDYRVFQSRNHYSKVEALRIAAKDKDGHYRWVPVSVLGSVSVYIDQILRGALIKHKNGDKETLEALMRNLIGNIPAEFRKHYQHIAVVQLIVKKDAQGKFEVHQSIVLTRTFDILE